MVLHVSDTPKSPDELPGDVRGGVEVCDLLGATAAEIDELGVNVTTRIAEGYAENEISSI